MTSQIVAKRYAKAFYNSLYDTSEMIAVVKDIKTLISLFDTVEGFDNFLKQPQLNPDDLAKFKNSVFDRAFQKPTVTFIEFLFKKKRLAELNNICYQFMELYYKENSIATVNLESAFELSKSEIMDIKKSIAKKLSKDIEIETSINKDLIGGIRFSYNNEIYDFSIANELSKFKRQLING